MTTPTPNDDFSSATLKLQTDIGHLLVDLRKTGPGVNSYLADLLTAKTGHKVSRNTVSMALSGYRATAAYVKYLYQLKECLAEMVAKRQHPLVTNNTFSLQKQEGKEACHVQP